MAAPYFNDEFYEVIGAESAQSDALPDGRSRTLAGQAHHIVPAVFAPVLEQFFAGSDDSRLTTYESAANERKGVRRIGTRSYPRQTPCSVSSTTDITIGDTMSKLHLPLKRR